MGSRERIKAAGRFTGQVMFYLSNGLNPHEIASRMKLSVTQIKIETDKIRKRFFSGEKARDFVSKGKRWFEARRR